MSKLDYQFCLWTLLIILIEVLILYLQKFFAIKYRKRYYNYYKTYKEIEQILFNENNNQKIELLICPICLSSFSNYIEKIIISENISISCQEKSEIPSLNDFSNDKRDKKYKLFCFKFLKRKQNLISITTCNQVFHSICLKQWFNQNRKCPICRKKHPLIE